MKKQMKKLIATFVLALLVVPMVGHAEDGIGTDPVEVGTFEELVAAVAEGGDIVLTADIKVASPIYVNKETHIYGEGHTLDGEGMVRDGSNGSIISAMMPADSGEVLYLHDMKIINANKYGVQAYNGGVVAVIDVEIANCKFGAILVNGGGLVVGNLTMADNGNLDNGGNGIEIGKGTGVSEDPIISMIGEITVNGDKQTQVLYLAENDELSTVGIYNEKDTANTIVIEGNKLVVKDANGNTKFESNEVKKDLQFEDLTEAPEVPEQPATPNPDEKVEENPNTYDGILGYVALAVAGLGLLTFSAKKALN